MLFEHEVPTVSFLRCQHCDHSASAGISPSILIIADGRRLDAMLCDDPAACLSRRLNKALAADDPDLTRLLRRALWYLQHPPRPPSRPRSSDRAEVAP